MNVKEFERFLDEFEKVYLAGKDGRKADNVNVDILRSFPGWGVVSPLFSEDDDTAWGKQRQRLIKLVGKDSFREIQRSSLDSFHTPPEIGRAMAEIGLSFFDPDEFSNSDLYVFEPGCGMGQLLHDVKTAASEKGINVTAHGIELSGVSAAVSTAIADNNDKILHAPIDLVDTENGTSSKGYELTVQNPPYGIHTIGGKLIATYFVDRSVDSMVDGGVGVFLVSSGVLDSKHSRELRKKLATSGNLIAAVRLPQIFENSSSSPYVIVWKKNERNPDWKPFEVDGNDDGSIAVSLDKYRDEDAPYWVDGITENGFNRVTEKHPEWVIGDIVHSTRRPGKYTVQSKLSNGEVAERLKKIVIGEIGPLAGQTGKLASSEPEIVIHSQSLEASHDELLGEKELFKELCRLYVESKASQAVDEEEQDKIRKEAFVPDAVKKRYQLAAKVGHEIAPLMEKAVSLYNEIKARDKTGEDATGIRNSLKETIAKIADCKSLPNRIKGMSKFTFDNSLFYDLLMVYPSFTPLLSLIPEPGVTSPFLDKPVETSMFEPKTFMDAVLISNERGLIDMDKLMANLERIGYLYHHDIKHVSKALVDMKIAYPVFGYGFVMVPKLSTFNLIDVQDQNREAINFIDEVAPEMSWMKPLIQECTNFCSNMSDDSSMDDEEVFTLNSEYADGQTLTWFLRSQLIDALGDRAGRCIRDIMRLHVRKGQDSLGRPCLIYIASDAETPSEEEWSNKRNRNDAATLIKRINMFLPDEFAYTTRPKDGSEPKRISGPKVFDMFLEATVFKGRKIRSNPMSQEIMNRVQKMHHEFTWFVRNVDENVLSAKLSEAGYDGEVSFSPVEKFKKDYVKATCSVAAKEYEVTDEMRSSIRRMANIPDNIQLSDKQYQAGLAGASGCQRALFWSMGSGKTAAGTIYLSCAIASGNIKKGLVIAPNDVVGAQWVHEARKFNPDLDIGYYPSVSFRKDTINRTFAELDNNQNHLNIIPLSGFAKLSINPELEIEITNEYVRAYERFLYEYQSEVKGNSTPDGRGSVNARSIAKKLEVYRKNLNELVRNYEHYVHNGRIWSGDVTRILSDTGIVIDEAHNAAGIDDYSSLDYRGAFYPASKKAVGINMRFIALHRHARKNGGEQLVLPMTGTPISNAVSDVATIYTRMTGEAITSDMFAIKTTYPVIRRTVNSLGLPITEKGAEVDPKNLRSMFKGLVSVISRTEMMDFHGVQPIDKRVDTVRLCDDQKEFLGKGYVARGIDGTPITNVDVITDNLDVDDDNRRVIKSEIPDVECIEILKDNERGWEAYIRQAEEPSIVNPPIASANTPDAALMKALMDITSPHIRFPEGTLFNMSKMMKDYVDATDGKINPLVLFNAAERLGVTGSTGTGNAKVIRYDSFESGVRSPVRPVVDAAVGHVIEGLRKADQAREQNDIETPGVCMVVCDYSYPKDAKKKTWSSVSSGATFAFRLGSSEVVGLRNLVREFKEKSSSASISNLRTEKIAYDHNSGEWKVTSSDTDEYVLLVGGINNKDKDKDKFGFSPKITRIIIGDEPHERMLFKVILGQDRVLDDKKRGRKATVSAVAWFDGKTGMMIDYSLVSSRKIEDSDSPYADVPLMKEKDASIINKLKSQARFIDACALSMMQEQGIDIDDMDSAVFAFSGTDIYFDLAGVAQYRDGRNVVEALMPSVYTQIRDKVSEKTGMPKDRIAVWQEYEVAGKTDELMDRLKSGDIRVVITPYSRVSEGLNIPSLYRIVTLNLPWTAKTFSQLLSRIERPGNLYNGLGTDMVAVASEKLAGRRAAILFEKSAVSSAILEALSTNSAIKKELSRDEAGTSIMDDLLRESISEQAVKIIELEKDVDSLKKEVGNRYEEVQRARSIEGSIEYDKRVIDEKTGYIDWMRRLESNFRQSGDQDFVKFVAVPSYGAWVNMYGCHSMSDDEKKDFIAKKFMESNGDIGQVFSGSYFEDSVFSIQSLIASGDINPESKKPVEQQFIEFAIGKIAERMRNGQTYAFMWKGVPFFIHRTEKNFASGRDQLKFGILNINTKDGNVCRDFGNGMSGERFSLYVPFYPVVKDKLSRIASYVLDPVQGVNKVIDRMERDIDRLESAISANQGKYDQAISRYQDSLKRLSDKEEELARLIWENGFPEEELLDEKDREDVRTRRMQLINTLAERLSIRDENGNDLTEEIMESIGISQFGHGAEPNTAQG
ncbi:MAG: hypothetical protein D6732_00420 [Methanobacteriota archaeon]|nr:MAG: hypothetical protein D6732_00420 [Euryarchaeota archaeon]